MNKFFKLDIDTNRVFGLDILRALAILFVVVGHGSDLLPKKLRGICNLFVFDGVTIFFVLSGFLIGGILIKQIDGREFNFTILKIFWIRRWYRTLPNYFLILTILCILNLFFNDEFSIWKVKNYFIFSQNLFYEHPNFFPESWSLTIEEWFYLIFPVLIFFMFSFLKSYRKSIFYVAILVVVSVTAFRFYRFSNISINGFSEWDLIFRKQVVTRMDSLMFGVVGAYIRYFHTNLLVKFKNQLLFTGIFIFIATNFLLPHFTTIEGIYSCVFSFTLISIATLFLLPYLSELKTSSGLLYRNITRISLLSYSMYLINLSIVQIWIISNIPWQRITDNKYIIVITNYSIYWLLVIGLSILIYKYFEIPMTSLRERFK